MLLIDYLITSTIISLSCVFVYIAFNGQGMLLRPFNYRVQYWLTLLKLDPNKWLQPLWGCLPCMCWFWSGVYVILFNLTFIDFVIIFPVVGGINYLLTLIINE